MRQPPFNSPQPRAELQQRLNAIPGVKIPDDALAKRPSFPLEALADQTALQTFLAVMDWSFGQARAAAPQWCPPGRQPFSAPEASAEEPSR
jgi:hypothetical protein